MMSAAVQAGCEDGFRVRRLVEAKPFGTQCPRWAVPCDTPRAGTGGAVLSLVAPHRICGVGPGDNPLKPDKSGC